jgi:hypothetical protein
MRGFLVAGAGVFGIIVLCGAWRDRSPAGFAAAVDEYLDWFARRHPSIAAGNGIHGHDRTLEDFSASAIRSEAGELRGWRSRIAAFQSTALTADERVDREILLGIVDGWLLDHERVQTWRRNPMVYASAVADGVHGLMVMESAPADARLRCVVSKLEGVPRLLQAARVNIEDPPAVFASRGAAMARGAAALLRDDLPLAFSNVSDPNLHARARTAAASAARELDTYAAFLESGLPARPSGSYAIGRENLEARYRAEELVDLPSARLLAIGERELEKTERAFEAQAARVAPGKDPRAAWESVLVDHPPAGEVVKAARQSVDDLMVFGRAERLLDLPPGEDVIVAPALPFDLGLASMHSSPPLEATPVKSYYYITDAQPGWPADQQEAWLRKFNYATLSDVSAHEVYPGHFAHSVFMRRTPGKIRRIWIGLNPFPQPSSGQDGWAHYAEQLVLDEGFRADDPRYRLAQLSEALTRICRLIAGIRLHADGWTVDQAAALFERRAHLPAPAARQEAERGTYDPTYGGYFLGKMALLKLRDDVRRRERERFDLRRFHERVLTNGIAPWRSHRQLLLPGDTGTILE